MNGALLFGLGVLVGFVLFMVVDHLYVTGWIRRHKP